MPLPGFLVYQPALKFSRKDYSIRSQDPAAEIFRDVE